ncbi:MAG: beta-ketoacyl synthase chain length factor [Lentisphaeria bacterium]|nr:beta-ketoacyl synthase chain length factor [Lentisphaeria bacterium]
MKIAGMGLVSSLGRGVQRHRDGGRPAGRRVPAETLKDRHVLRGMRRADRFCAFATLAAYDALTAGNATPDDTDDTMGIILLTALGPQATTFGFLDDIIDYGEKEVSPIKFSHSVHNAAAYYVAAALGCRGPTTTIATFDDPFAKGIQLAGVWLSSGRARRVLVGCVEELSAPFDHIHDHLLNPEQAARMRPFAFAMAPVEALSEGAAFLLLTPSDDGADRLTGINMRTIADLLAAAETFGNG